MGIALVGVVLWGSRAGSMLPFLCAASALIPRHPAAPFVATLVDVTGLIIYFSIALLPCTAHALTRIPCFPSADIRARREVLRSLEASAQQADTSVQRVVACSITRTQRSPQASRFRAQPPQDKEITQELTEQLVKTFITHSNAKDIGPRGIAL